ncbi:hypothetical protein BP6252_13236 [Coleophoma cylindrospora]|uniref:Heterokaryon incompatibility domain-containing protein n=1 Tax=Coleophoma cylindrospora TaxID=1849047 RepID=A0A3D8QAT9_9HELO|nr:hypothetical protein BP6252_13236 [Coleophoma cylindrospora]
MADPGGDTHIIEIPSHANTPQSPEEEQPVRSAAARRIPKCGYCRRDHKKCERATETAKCERCKDLGYGCFGGLESAISHSPKRCEPTNRKWPAICNRCRERGLPCSEPSSTKKKRRTLLEKALTPSNDHSEPEISREIIPPPRFIPMTNQATPPETPQAWTEMSDIYIQPLQSVGESGHQAPSGIMTEDVENLAILSHAADRVGSILPFPLSGPNSTCHFCTQLQLAPDRFVVEDRYNHRKRPMPRGHLNQKQDFDPPPIRRENKTSAHLDKVKLGSIAEIKVRSQQCRFCRLVCLAAYDQVQNSPYDQPKVNTMIAYASWQLDGRERFSGGSGQTFSKPRTRRIRLHWEIPDQYLQNTEIKLSDAYVVLVADNKWSRKDLFLGRPIHPGRDVIKLIKDWVGQCQRHHFHSNDVTPAKDFAKVIAEKRFMLLDVGTMRTVFPNETEPEYVALSYAAKEAFLGKLGNIKQSEHNEWIDQAKLPPELQDAIELVRKLDFQYLWVHPLCTIYDKSHTQERRKYPRDQNYHIMDQIFGNSSLTIVAADEPRTGLPALKTPRPSVTQHIEKLASGLQLMLSHPVDTHLKNSKWATRAWTFQERFLAKRCLIFAGGRVWFQCRDAAASEDIIEDLKESCWSVDMLGTPAQTIGDFQDSLHAIRAYMTCVEAYTVRELTLQDDILVAFEGFSRMIGTSLDTYLLHGLPSAFLDLALLWEFKGTTGKSEKQPGKRRETNALRKFPSWSWCGWESSITYRNSTLLGVQSNIPAWLSMHTWISWYVIDRFNILRQLHRSGQEPISPPKYPAQKKWMPDNQQAYDIWREPKSHSVSPQRMLKWPTLNRSTFFKSVRNLQPDVMDIDSDAPEDLKVRDTEHLQFWTWSAFFRLTERQDSHNLHLGTGISSFGILDYNDDFCGTITLPDKWYDEQVATHREDSVFEFIAISEAKDFSPEEFDGWTYYIAKERDQREWDLWYVLLVEKVDDVVVRRVALGKIFQEAFENSFSPGKEWREFIMV